jgi:hypothetical protein
MRSVGHVISFENEIALTATKVTGTTLQAKQERTHYRGEPSSIVTHPIPQLLRRTHTAIGKLVIGGRAGGSALFAGHNSAA